MRATRDIGLREGFIAGTGLRLAEPLVAPYLGAGSDGPSIAMLMPDLTNELIAWDRPGQDPVVGPATLDHVIDGDRRAACDALGGLPADDPGLGLAVVPAARAAAPAHPPVGRALPRGGPRRRRSLPGRVGCVRTPGPGRTRGR